MLPYTDRRHAGRLLARALEPWQGSRPLVLALPRGGVPVGYEVARALGGELDLMLVRKLGAPGQPELAMGAIASGGVRVLNPGVVATLGVDEAAIEAVAADEAEELRRRERAYRGERPWPGLAGRTVILVDDGIATGATMRAAVAAARAQGPAEIVVAAPVAPPDTVEQLRGEADAVVVPETPEPFYAIGQWYVAFPQLTDEEVRALLREAWEEAPAPEGAGGGTGGGGG